MLTSLVSNPVLYSVGSRAYEWLTTHSAQRQAFEAVSAKLPATGRILDVACGPGVLMAALANRKREIFGVDLAVGALARASRRGLVTRADATDLPFDDSHFDAVVIAGALYLMPDAQKVLREIGRVTKGPVVVLEGSSQVRVGEAVFGSGYELRERLDMAVWSFAISRTQRYDQSTLESTMKQASLKGVQVESVGRGLFLLGTGRLDKGDLQVARGAVA